MSLALLPEPKSLRVLSGRLVLPPCGTIAVSDPSLRPAAVLLNRRLALYTFTTPAKGVSDTVLFTLKPGMKRESYRLAIAPQGIRVEAGDGAGARHAVWTLGQVMDQCADGRLPCLTVDDAPDFAARGVYYDVCRGRVPTLPQFMAQIDRLAEAKVNQLQYYIEHTYRFRRHPLIGQQADPLTADDLMRLDARCQTRGIELVPSLASFGHMSNILTLAPYRALAEDYGIGKFVTTEGLSGWLRSLRGWTLSPANPKIYDFIDSLFAEFLPCFSSDKFNVCCDETFDLGCGQSHELCKAQGKGRVYLDHILRLHELCAKYGKRMQFWGDIVRHHPEFIKALPKDVTVLDWGYNYDHNFEAIRDFTRTGLATYACPGTGSWGAIFPRMVTAEANIAGFAAAGKKHGAVGLLNTDWGDGGHFNFMEYSWPGYWFGAEQAWNTGADRTTFLARFCRLFLKSTDRALPVALRELGDIAELAPWLHVFHASPSDGVFGDGKHRACVRRKGQAVEAEVRLDAALAATVTRRLSKARAVFSAHAGRAGEDPEGVLPYWIFAIDSILFAARKWVVLSKGVQVTASERRHLAAEMKVLRGRFEALWMARNRRSEIRTTLSRYQRALAELGKPVVPAVPFVTTLRVSGLMPPTKDICNLAPPVSRAGLRLKQRSFAGTFCDMHREIEKGGTADHLLYYVRRFRCAEPMRLRALLGYDGPVRMWVDGEDLYADPKGTNPAVPAAGKATFAAAEGEHELMVALGTNHGKAWGIFLQLERMGAARQRGKTLALPEML